MFISMFAQTLLLEEECELDASPKDQLLNEIQRLGREMVAYATTSELESMYGKVRPRDKIWFPWRTRRMTLWRLEQLWHPLWLGEDGVIYRGYDSSGGSRYWLESPDYWLRAEIELRSESGLKRVLDALKTLEPTAGSLGSGAEM